MVRKHLKDVANDAEGDVMSEKNPTHVKNTGLLPQGTRSKAGGIQPVNWTTSQQRQVFVTLKMKEMLYCNIISGGQKETQIFRIR
ncbi:hypothetical protein HanLR1_Chr12g0434601 [Helianthus annuus]|nr:hypothetical protein HanHA89_Chr12g0457131 [Helianthus annuus]KAJ0673948.1 hypothetical protein HanLR1_Chr12g0434601 [Helianthus annuus]